MAGSTSSTNPNQGQILPIHNTPPNPNTNERATTSGASPHISVASSALTHPRSRTSQSAASAHVLPASQTHTMVRAEIPTRVRARYDPRRIGEHFAPPAPANVNELLEDYEHAYRDVKASRPVDEGHVRAFQAKQQVAFQLEHQAAVATHRAELLSASAKFAESLQEFKNKAVLDGAKDLAEAVGKLIPLSQLRKEVKQAQRAAETLRAQVKDAWDDALVDYSAAHNLDMNAFEAGAKRGGPRYATRVIPPALLGLAATAPGLIPAESVEGKFYVSLGSTLGVFVLAGVATPVSYAAATLPSVTWADLAFDHAADIQNLLKTPMVEQVAERLSTARQEAKDARIAWHAVRNGPPSEARSTAWATLQATQHELKAAQFDYLMRVDLNRIYIHGFQDQGILNFLKYLGNLAVGPISAAVSPLAGWFTQGGVAGGHFAGHMLVSGDDEKSKQTRMLYLRMRASDVDLGPADGPERDEAQVSEGLENFSKDIRSPHRVRQNAIKEVLTTDLRKIDGDIAKILGVQPNDVKLLEQWKALQASGGEADDMDAADRARAPALEDRIETIVAGLEPEHLEKYNQLMSDRNDVAADIQHVEAGTFSQVSDRNKARIYYGLQVTPPGKGIVDAVKNAMGPLSPEFRLGMVQGGSRIERPEEFLTTLGLAYWAAFQLAICGENGPLILSKIVNFIMAADAVRRQEHISPEANLAVQSGLTALNLAVAAILMWASAKVIDMAMQPQGKREWTNRFAAGRSSAANTVYLGGLLKRREPHRDEQKRTAPDAGFQQVGAGALKSGKYWSELKTTLGAGMADLAKEAPSAGKAREEYLASAALEDEIQADIDTELTQLASELSELPPYPGDPADVEESDDEEDLGESSRQAEQAGLGSSSRGEALASEPKNT